MLDHCNTLNATGLSPVQMMMDRSSRMHQFTRHELLLMSNSHQLAANEKHLLKKENNRKYHNQHVMWHSNDFQHGQRIVMRKPGQQNMENWHNCQKDGTPTEVGPRSRWDRNCK